MPAGTARATAARAPPPARARGAAIRASAACGWPAPWAWLRVSCSCCGGTCWTPEDVCFYTRSFIALPLDLIGSLWLGLTWLGHRQTKAKKSELSLQLLGYLCQPSLESLDFQPVTAHDRAAVPAISNYVERLRLPRQVMRAVGRDARPKHTQAESTSN